MVDCIHLPVISLQEFGERLYRTPGPWSGGIEITQRCNLECVHCYCRQPANDLSARTGELGFEAICRIVDEAAAMGCLTLFITGGEPLVRNDFLDIYDYIRSKGILPVIFTNATLITSRIADHLAENPPLFIEISAYGRSREVYERITQRPGSFDRFMAGLEHLVERGLKVFLKTPALTLNRDELGALGRFAEELGTSFRFDTSVHPRLHGVQDRYQPYEFGLPLEERIELEFSVPGRVKAWHAYADRVEGMTRQTTVYTCGAGLYGFFVDFQGHLSMCVTSRYPSYDLLAGTFEEGWKFLRGLRTRVGDDVDSLTCQQCEIRAYCLQCPGRSQLEYGPSVLTKPVDWLCKLAHLRAEKMKLIQEEENSEEQESV